MITNRKKMHCKDFKKISLLFVDNDLSDELKASADDHLVSCALCKAYFQNLTEVYSSALPLSKDIKTDLYFYTRLKARMEAVLSAPVKNYRQISYYLQPAFYTLIALTLFLSVLILTGNVKNSQQSPASSTLVQTNTNEEQDYLKTIAMNDQTFEEDYINLIDK